MSVIGKIPYIHQILSSLSSDNLIRFEALLNHALPEPIVLSLIDKNYAITDEHKGVNYVKLYTNDKNVPVLLGFLCYIDNTKCGLFVFYEHRNEGMLSVEIDLDNKRIIYHDEGLDIDELRSELRSFINEKTSGDFNAHVLENYIKGSDTIVVDWDATDSHLMVKIDENFKQRVEEGMAHEIDLADSDVPETSMQGTLDEEDYLVLINFPRSTIFFNNERYYPMDDGHQEGYIGYSHIGYENGVFNLKNITITKSTRGWVLNTKEVS